MKLARNAEHTEDFIYEETGDRSVLVILGGHGKANLVKWSIVVIINTLVRHWGASKPQ